MVANYQLSTYRKGKTKMGKLVDKIAIVTGAARGIGAKIAVNKLTGK